MFHYINENNVTYLCLAGSAFKLDLAYQYLEDLKDRFLNKYDEDVIHTSIAYALNSFKVVLKERVVILDLYDNPKEFYNSDEADKMKMTMKHLN